MVGRRDIEMAAWMVQTKGKIGPGPHDYHEISVVRKDNEHGQHSWGWGGFQKIILFGTGMGQNRLFPVTEEEIRFAYWIADTLCAALNEREGRNE
jgi:hypothetical protein